MSYWRPRVASYMRFYPPNQVANLAANHQASDLIVVEGLEQLLHARFCYGPMDLVVLSYENVLVYVLPSRGQWFLKGVETTDKNGRLSINLGRSLPIGMHNVRMIVQGDRKSKGQLGHLDFYNISDTYLSVNVAVVSSGTSVVVFSIDGFLIYVNIYSNFALFEFSDRLSFRYWTRSSPEARSSGCCSILATTGKRFKKEALFIEKTTHL